MRKSIAVKNKIEIAELIKVALFRKNVRTTSPHTHNNYFEIIYLSKGSGIHAIDYNYFPIEPPTIFLVRQEQIHHWDIKSEPEGYVLLLRKGFLEKSLDNELKKLFTDLSTLNCLHLAETETIEALFKLLVTEQNFTVIEGLLKSLLAKIISIAQPFTISSKTDSDLAALFRSLLNHPEKLVNSVSYYAEKLNTTPQNLNAYCRKTLNKSASELISEHIISEAKRLLIYTDSTVSQIAYALKFSDTSHFVKYFKRYVNATPQAFRNSSISHNIFK